MNIINALIFALTLASFFICLNSTQNRLISTKKKNLKDVIKMKQYLPFAIFKTFYERSRIKASQLKTFVQEQSC